jgi:hypothetical protein
MNPRRGALREATIPGHLRRGMIQQTTLSTMT